MNNPKYVTSRWSRDNRIATRCRICGGQLTHPTDMKNEVHDKCIKEHKRKTYGVN
jgi:ribosomal protein S27E|tara:strand:- start:1292 stop:1456 length:165 start_codon:yes stop_codon:yes gene_type:complete